MLSGLDITECEYARWKWHDVVGLVASAQWLDLAELWIALGVGKNVHSLLHMKKPRYLVLINALHFMGHLEGIYKEVPPVYSVP